MTTSKLFKLLCKETIYSLYILILQDNSNFKTDFLNTYCKSLKYSGINNKAIIALRLCALFKNPVFIKLPNVHI